MPKTLPPATLRVPRVGRVEANAAPDCFDARDLPYRPRLQPLPPVLDTRTLASRYVMKQRGSSCTGHAVATVVNTVLAQSRPETAVHVSPYMLYALGRRYDDFPGEDDLGSSLRGVLKGWFEHGVAPEDRWPLLDSSVPLDDPELVRVCRGYPLGAFYRVTPQRLDDVQSALCELHAVAVSAQIHHGWLTPTRRVSGGEESWVIERGRGAEPLGGHAFALVGYNDVGFLVQNSWGVRWGKGGFATLPYEDWLDSAYDAWVVRPGVPQTPFGSGRTRTARVTGGALATGPAPDLERLARHVVNLGNEGRLSGTGKFVSTPEQLDRILASMGTYHAQWAAEA
ncbi:MAG TPA: C1 family peptidase, partial [Longimicrobiaceae bacterium]|nr:C1 family peptidase [Longimicrobiaceae bacterium]